MAESLFHLRSEGAPPSLHAGTVIGGASASPRARKRSGLQSALVGGFGPSRNLLRVDLEGRPCLVDTTSGELIGQVVREVRESSIPGAERRARKVRNFSESKELFGGP